jgi:hypothetical protein
MGSNLIYANAETLTPGSAWRRMSNDERLSLINDAIANHFGSSNEALEIVEVKVDGQVIVTLHKPVSANKRGTLLLDLEDLLKQLIDPGLVVWLEPLGDRSSLRNLRGIEVKA